MKRALVLLLALLLAASVAVPAAASGTTTAYEVTELKADFHVKARQGDGIALIMIAARMKRDVDSGSVVGRAAAGINRCDAAGDSCFVAMRSYRIVTFEVDQRLETAHLVIKRGRQRHELHFRTALPRPILPPLYQNPNLCEGTTTAIVIDGRNAYAQGNAFGHKVATGDDVDPDLDVAESIERRVEVEDCP